MANQYQYFPVCRSPTHPTALHAQLCRRAAERLRTQVAEERFNGGMEEESEESDDENDGGAAQNNADTLMVDSW